MTKVMMLSVHLKDQRLVVAALKAAFSPFVALTGGKSADDLVDAMMDFVSARGAPSRIFHAKRTMEYLWWGTNHPATVEFGSGVVTLRTSETKITLVGQTVANDYLNVKVYFGEAGSSNRAVAILSAAKQARINFLAYDVGGKPIIHKQALDDLFK